MLRRELPAPVVTIDGTAQKASSLLGYAGAYSVTLSTTLPTLALELHSTYLGHSQTATIAAHLLLRPDACTVRTVEHAAGALPVAGAEADQPGARGRAALLLDHLSELQLQLTAISPPDTVVRVDVDDAALRELELG